jgi:hypothetical protein
VAKSRRKHRLFWILSLGSILLHAGAGASAFTLLRADPSWYERVALDPERQAAGERELRDRLATLHNDIGRSQVAHARGEAEWPAFEMRIGEDEVNGVIARWYDASAGLRDALGELREPHVRFLKDRVEIAGRSTRMDSLISIELGVERDADGTPTVQLGRPWAGRLPLSRSLIDGAAVVGKLRAGNESGMLPDAFLDALVKLLNGEPVHPPIVAVSSSFNGTALLPARVEKLSIDGGKLVATLRPFTPDASTTQSAPRR